MSEPDVIDGEWAEVERRWDDPRAHTAFLELCRLSGTLPRAAALYRAAAADEARKGEAEKRIAAISFLALSSLEATRTAPTKGLPRWAMVTIAIFFGSLVAYTIARAIGM